MTYQTFDLSVDQAIATIRLNRPDALNTMIPAFWTEMVEVFQELQDRFDVRAVVIASSGKHFTAGLDLGVAKDLFGKPGIDEGRKREKLHRKILSMQNSFSAIETCRVPVISAIQGGCIGGGVDLVTACDMRVGARGCFFTIQEINLGMVADVGTLQRLPHLLPQGLVRELAFTGRRFSDEEALAHGFLNRLEESAEAAFDAAMAMARDIATKSPLAIAGIKHVLNKGRAQTVEQGLEYVAAWNAGMILTEDVQKGAMSILHKQQAEYDDLIA
ncbi:MAG: crotonase/enoyl-CoA hydratase family protein [Pseudomonadota bacterium]